MLRAPALLAVLPLFARVNADEDDDDGGNLVTYVDVNPSFNSTLLSSCKAGLFGFGTACTACADGFTTEVWSVQPVGSGACEYPPDDDAEEDEDGEDSDDWLPSLAACKSTCVGTCPGIVWTEPVGPASCMKCAAGMTWTKSTGALTAVHRRTTAGAVNASHCAMCSNGLTWSGYQYGPDNGAATGECEKTGVCSSIGDTPYYKVSGRCLPCPPEEDLGSALQVITMIVLLFGGGALIWVSAAAGDTTAGTDDNVQLTAQAGPLLEAAAGLVPTFQFMAAAFSCDLSWPSFIADLGVWMKTIFVGNFTGVATPECLFSYGQFKDDDRYLAVLGSKFGIVVLFGLVFGAIAAATGSERAVSALAGVYIFMLILISSACFTAINVTELPDGHYALVTLPSISSQTDDFGAMIAYGVIGLLIFLVIIPGLLYSLLSKAAKDGNLWDPTTRNKFGSLFLRYRPSCWWYEFVVMGRKIVLAGIAILLPGVACMVMSMLIVGASIGVHHKLRPFQSSGHKITQEQTEGEEVKHMNEDEDDELSKPDKLELACMAALLATYAIGLLCAVISPTDDSGGSYFLVFLTLCALFLPGVAAVFLNMGEGTAEDDSDDTGTDTDVTETAKSENSLDGDAADSPNEVE
jgi:hypothetical protein